MSRRQQTNQTGDSTNSRPGNPRMPAVTWVLLAAAIGLMVVLGWPMLRSSNPQPAAPVIELAKTNPSTGTAPSASALEKLKGKWLRPDGGYVLEITSADANGKLDATYANPRPIQVSKAQASYDGSATNVFIELQGENYRGSTYELSYNPADDQLKGIYFQAAMRQRFEVSFERMK